MTITDTRTGKTYTETEYIARLTAELAAANERVKELERELAEANRHSAALRKECDTCYLRTRAEVAERELAVSRAKARAFDLWHSKACAAEFAKPEPDQPVSDPYKFNVPELEREVDDAGKATTYSREEGESDGL